MQITIDTKYDSHDDLRSAAAFLLHIVGDLGQEETPDPKAPSVPNAATAPAIASSVAPVAGIVPPPPNIPQAAGASDSKPWLAPPPPPVPVSNDDGEDTPSNVVNFPEPPPPPATTPVATGAEVPNATATPASTTTSLSATNTSTTFTAVEFDKSGMPWDARIHQKSKNKKKDGNWKLIKGIDPAIVQAVTIELATTKAAAPASGTVLLPAAQAQQPAGAVPVPPPPPIAAPTGVPAPPASSTVPVPPVAAAGSLGGVTFRDLIDKLTAATKANLITPAKVNEICTGVGAPNLMQLDKMQHLIPDVSARVDAFLAGLG